MFVVDASVAIKLYVQEEDSDIARQLFDRGDKKFQLYAPDIIIYELANKLKKEYPEDEAYKKINSFINEYLENLTPIFRGESWEIGIGTTGDIGLFHSFSYEKIDLQKALNIARNHQLSFYDATYVMLAQKFKIKLVTCDKELLRKFPDDTISLQKISPS